jgi:hypothetical protein
LKVKCFNNITKPTSFIKGLKSLANNNFTDLRVFGNRVHILNLYKGFQIVFKKLCEVVLKLRSSEKFQNVFPSWDRLIFT